MIDLHSVKQYITATNLQAGGVMIEGSKNLPEEMQPGKIEWRRQRRDGRDGKTDVIWSGKCLSTYGMS